MRATYLYWFFIYGPQAFIGTVAANIATKRAAAVAIAAVVLFVLAWNADPTRSELREVRDDG